MQYENPFLPQNVSELGSLIFNLLRQWQFIFKASINHKEKKLTVSRNETKILTVNRKRHNSIETVSVMKQKHDFQVCIVDRARHRKKLVKTRNHKKQKRRRRWQKSY